MNNAADGPSPKRRQVCGRLSAEAARKRLKLEFAPGGEQPQSSSADDASSSIGSSGGVAAQLDGCCERTLCAPDERKLDCCLRIAKGCVDRESPGTGGSLSRWFHVSIDEHFCANCQEEFSKPGRLYSEEIAKWKLTWAANSRKEATSRMFVAEELLPVWLQCVECTRWRSVECVSATELTSAFARRFTCASADTACAAAETSAVASARDNVDWLRCLSVPALLHASPAVHFLRQEYFNDEVGVSPTHAEFQVTDELLPPKSAHLQIAQLFKPFNMPHEGSMAMSVRPDIMEYDELIAFPEYATEQAMYLGVRNLIVALWNMNPLRWLTERLCAEHILCRGLMRVRCVAEMRRILRFLTLKGIVNIGVLVPNARIDTPLHLPSAPVVVVIGAGISGLCAARQLSNFGANVRVLEAKHKIGGRMIDDWSLGVAVGCGAQLVTGVVNNPIVLMCLQTNVAYRCVTDECPLIDATTGETTDATVDRRVDFHFNCMLDALTHWKKERGGATAKDATLEKKMMQMHNLFLSQSKLRWPEDEQRVLEWQLGNVEFSCGAPLKSVSAKNWDQNEEFAQFAGEHALLSEGSKDILNKLSEGLECRTGMQVTAIDYSKSGPRKITISCKSGKSEMKIKCDKVLVTVPLAVLQKHSIRFTPPLPERKQTALKGLGAGIIEKVAVKFSRRFWDARMNGSDYFGHVPESRKDRGLFNMFYDFSARGHSDKSGVLMSYVCAGAVERYNKMKDMEIVQLFCETLEQLFPEEDIPEPEGHVVTHWFRDPYVGMSYSFIRVGSSGDDYDGLSADIDQRIFFAGEATNRYFPQTMTGAYLTGLREAGKIGQALLEGS